MRTGRMISAAGNCRLVWLHNGVVSAGAQEPFIRGKTIRLIVGLAPGGGYDLYSRTIARQMGKHIPGNPTVVVENMDGAGSLIAANYMYKAAKPDGLTIGHILVVCSCSSWEIQGSSSTAANSNTSASRLRTIS